MRDNGWGKPLVFLVLLLSGVTLAQVNPEKTSVVVNGNSGEAAVVRINSRTYIDLENMARIANGSVAFHGHQITLILPGSGARAPATPEPDQPVSPAGLSRNFMIAGIETIAQLREWGSTMAYAIQNGYGVTEGWANDYREKAANSLRLASAAASSEADRNALQLLTNEFTSVGTWSDNLVDAKKSMDTAKYSTSPNVLRDEPLSQKIINCGRFLGKMLGSAEFKDDPSCH
jgi:hypothetical protein